MADRNQILLKLGKNLRKAREKRGWSQEAFAFKCGVHRTYVGLIERGEYNVTILTLRKFTQALGTTLREALRACRRRECGGHGTPMVLPVRRFPTWVLQVEHLAPATTRTESPTCPCRTATRSILMRESSRTAADSSNSGH